MTGPSTARDSRRQLLAHAPPELLAGPLHRLGEGIGKIVYASPHWVVKRERSPNEIMALIVIWKAVRGVQSVLPAVAARFPLQHASHRIRLLRLATQGAVSLLPRTWWYTTHAWEVLKQYHRASRRGERLAELHLEGTMLVPETVEFPPVRVQVSGWPGHLTVSEATERVEADLFRHLSRLARHGLFEEVELWLNRLLELRRTGWSQGVFSVDSHLKNYGVIGNRVVLLDAGGLTNRWADIERRLAFEDNVELPHVVLGLGPMLKKRPDIAGRFNARWKETVNEETVREQWPG